MENNDRMREEFEARWAQQNPGIDPQRAGDFYYNDAAQIAWSWWKAGYLQASRMLAASVKLFNSTFPTSEQVEKAIQSARRILRGET